jgi:hypothetical protein
MISDYITGKDMGGSVRDLIYIIPAFAWRYEKLRPE